MKRTLDDIRENLPFVGCDNATALEMCDRIAQLEADNAALSAMLTRFVTIYGDMQDGNGDTPQEIVEARALLSALPAHLKAATEEGR